MPSLDWRHLPSLSSLRAFEAASRFGNFSAAARALNVTHAAVSQAVRGLEAELGTALLRRDGRWLFARREETPLQYKPGPPPMSEEAVGVSGATMRAEGV